MPQKPCSIYTFYPLRIRALEYGMPPSRGIGFGIDRLAMMFTGQMSIRRYYFSRKCERRCKSDANSTRPQTNLSSSGSPLSWRAAFLKKN